MRRIRIKITLLLTSFLLASCGILPINSNDSAESLSSNNDVSISKEDDYVVSLTASDSWTNYSIGNIYQEEAIKENHLKVTANYKFKGAVKVPYKTSTSSDGFTFSFANDYLKNSYDVKKPFQVAGAYTICIFYKGFTTDYTINIASGYDLGYSIDSFEIIDENSTYSKNDLFLDVVSISLIAKWNNNIYESFFINSNNLFEKMIDIKLFKYGTTLDVINNHLIEKQKYEYSVSLSDKNKKKITNNKSFITTDGFYRVKNITEDYHSLNPVARTSPVGTKRILVIPIAWSDQVNRATKAATELIRKSYFGSRLETKWNSLKTYYQETSYGQYDVDGYIAPWYFSNYSSSDIINGGNTYSYYYAIAAAKSALQNFKDKNPSFDFSLYDSDKNGYLDAVHFVNTASQNSDYYATWGWQTYLYNDYSNANVSDPNINCVAWFNTSFLNDLDAYCPVPAGGVNSRVIIHEHGHILGLDDYYDYMYTGIDAVGRWDMQSNNVGDWNPFSKYTVGWLKPYVVNNESTEFDINIRPSALYGDAIVVPSGSHEDNAFGEYLLIDYYTPEGLNEYDANKLNDIYAKNNLKLDVSGVRIYHVDARINAENKFNNNNYKDAGGPYLLQLIQAGKQNTFTKKGSYRHERNNEDLFLTNSTFSMNEYSEFFYNNGKLNNGSDINYSIKITKITKESATLHFTKTI